jgi:signal transduction histidine kinase
MTLFALSGLLILITSTSLGILVLIKTPHIQTNRLWAYFNFAISLLGLAFYKIGTTLDPKTAFLWFKIGMIGVIAIPIVFLHFICSFLEEENKTTIISTYIIGFIFLITLLTNHLVAHVNFIFNSFYFVNQPSTFFSILLFFWVTAVIYTYHIAYKKSKVLSNIKRNQLKYLFLACTTGYIGGSGNFLLIYGIKIYPYGNFLLAFFPVVITYVILKYNLMDINIIIRRSLIYSLLVTSITLIFLISVLISEHLFHQVAHYQDITTSIIMASFIALIFTPLRNKIQSLVDRAFFKASPMEISQQNEQLKKEIIASERMKTVAILASGLAHEIKNPLTPIKTFSEQLPFRLEDKEFLLKFSRIISKEVDRIDNLVQQLLNFAKPAPPLLKQINIHQLIEQTLELLNNDLIRHKININTSFENKNILIHLDPQQIKQALLNVFLNAIDAMPEGGLISVNTNIQSDKLCLTITDTGQGINPEDIKHIFDPFFSKKDQGTGLGLSITYEIIKNHNGKIFVESKLGKGTAFRIELPL